MCVCFVYARTHTYIGTCRLSARQSTRTIRAAAGQGEANAGATPGRAHIVAVVVYWSCGFVMGDGQSAVLGSSDV